MFSFLIFLFVAESHELIKYRIYFSTTTIASLVTSLIASHHALKEVVQQPEECVGTCGASFNTTCFEPR